MLDSNSGLPKSKQRSGRSHLADLYKLAELIPRQNFFELWPFVFGFLLRHLQAAKLSKDYSHAQDLPRQWCPPHYRIPACFPVQEHSCLKAWTWSTTSLSNSVTCNEKLETGCVLLATEQLKKDLLTKPCRPHDQGVAHSVESDWGCSLMVERGDINIKISSFLLVTSPSALPVQ